MRRIAALFIIGVILSCSLCSCSSGSNDVGFDADDIMIMQRNSVYENVYNHGEFYSDNNGSLRFFDFTSMVSAPICSKPNCTHTDESECTSFGLDNHPALIGDKIYYFTTNLEYDDDNKPKYVTSLHSANVDGSGRVLVSSIDNISLWKSNDAYIYNNVIYFVADKMALDEGTMMFDSGTKCICSCDYTTGEFKIYGEFEEGYSTGIMLRGYYKDKLYCVLSYLDQENPYLNLSAEELNNSFEEIYAWETEHIVYEVYSLDIDTGEVLPSDIPEKFDTRSNMFARDGYFVYSDDTGMYAIDYNGNETSFPGEEIDKISAKMVNGIFIQFTSKKAYNLSTGEVFDIKSPDGLTDYEINDLELKDYIRDEGSEYGNYIFSYIEISDDGSSARNYISIPENELIVPNE